MKNNKKNLGEVSIQPKPKNGLEVSGAGTENEVFQRFNPAEAEEWFRSTNNNCCRHCLHSFNPAEAEEWFRSMLKSMEDLNKIVSIQPKPKKGLSKAQHLK